MDNEIDRIQRIGIIARFALRRPRVSTSGRAEAARKKAGGRPARAIPRGPDLSWRSCRKSLRSCGIRSAEPTRHEQPKMPSPSMRRPSGAPGDGRRFRGRFDRFAWRAGAVGRRRGGGGSISPGGASREVHCRRGDAGGAFRRRRAEGGHGGDGIDAVPAGIAGRPAATGFRIGDERAGRRSPTWTGSGSPSPPIPGRARGPRRSRRRSAVPSGPRFGGPVRANATPGSARMPASPGPIGRGSSGSEHPVPIPASADRLIHMFECRGARGPPSSRLAAAPWQRLAALDRSPEFPGGTKRRSTRYSESGFSARRQLRIVSNSPSSASSPRRIAGNKRFLNSIVCARRTTLSRAATTRTARSASSRARQAPPGRPRPGR